MCVVKTAWSTSGPVLKLTIKYAIEIFAVSRMSTIATPSFGNTVFVHKYRYNTDYSMIVISIPHQARLLLVPSELSYDLRYQPGLQETYVRTCLRSAYQRDFWFIIVSCLA